MNKTTICWFLLVIILFVGGLGFYWWTPKVYPAGKGIAFVVVRGKIYSMSVYKALYRIDLKTATVKPPDSP